MIFRCISIRAPRWARTAIVGVALVTTVGGCGAGPGSAERSCGVPAASGQVTGEVLALDGARAQVRADEVIVQTTGTAPPPALTPPAPGETMEVDYGGDEDLLAVGDRYQVVADGSPGRWESRIRRPSFGAAPCSGGWTRHADGTDIETNWFARHHALEWGVAAFGAMIATIVVVESIGALRRRTAVGVR